MEPIKNIRDFRLRLGLNQQDFAQLLQCKRSLLSMVEMGTRTLPGNAALNLARLETWYYVAHQRTASMARGVGGLQDHPASLEKAMRDKRLLREAQLQTLRKKLEHMEAAYSSAVLWLNILSQMTTETAAVDSHWIARQEGIAGQTLEMNSLAEQEMLKTDISELQNWLNSDSNVISDVRAVGIRPKQGGTNHDTIIKSVMKLFLAP
ncbi:MAG: hypothetical protein JWQ27_2088 [Ferruginibacter sp.]|nr:hypothetical protein [Ferruginibacter sp.]